MKRHLALAALTLMVGGCAVQPIRLQDRAAESYQVSVKTMIVDNLATETKIEVSDIVYVNGWAPAHAGFRPPLHESFVAKVRNSIVARGMSGRVDVAVLRVGFFLEKDIADDIVFVGLFMLGRERGFKCDADVNVKTESDSRRITLSHEVTTHPCYQRHVRPERSEWPPAGCSPDSPWTADSLRFGNRLRRTCGCGSILRLSA